MTVTAGAAGQPDITAPPLPPSQGPAQARAGTSEATGRRILAVDGTGLLVRASRAQMGRPLLMTSGGIPTGTLMSFIGSLARKIRASKPDYLVVAWDGANALQWRREMYPGYKGSRVDHDGNGREVLQAQAFCAAAGIRQLEMPFFEADDILAAVWRHVTIDGAELNLATDDADLLQLLGDDMTVVTGLTSDAPITAADVEKTWQIWPWWMPAMRSLSGDHSDNIPGLPGIGRIRAARMIRDGGFRWPLPEKILPDPEQREKAETWRSVMELANPPVRPEKDAGEAPFLLAGQAEWHGGAPGEVLDFLSTHELSALLQRLQKGRLW